MEQRFGGSVGKLLLHLEVVNEAGGRPDLPTLVRRLFVRFPFWPALLLPEPYSPRWATAVVNWGTLAVVVAGFAVTFFRGAARSPTCSRGRASSTDSTGDAPRGARPSVSESVSRTAGPCFPGYATAMSRKPYVAGDVEVSFDPGLCFHAAEWSGAFPQVFDTSATPWIRPEKASAAELQRVVARCPSGALQFRRLQTTGPTAPRAASLSLVPATGVLATVMANGPVVLTGPVVVLRQRRARVVREAERVAFCRCGASVTKPFCDGSHAKAGFRAPWTAPSRLAPRARRCGGRGSSRRGRRARWPTRSDG